MMTSKKLTLLRKCVSYEYKCVLKNNKFEFCTTTLGKKFNDLISRYPNRAGARGGKGGVKSPGPGLQGGPDFPKN